jgi:sugar lactone lactonase YvrE
MIHRRLFPSIVALLFSLICLSSPVATLAAELLAPGAKVERAASGFVFTEGPACDAKGNVYFTDIANERIHKWSVDGKLTTFREKTGRANGLYFDREGNLLACEGGNRRLTSISPDGMTLDEQGNLYLSRGVVHVFSPEGKKITTIEVPEAPTNICFGGKDRRTLFITARKGLYSIRMNVRGQ